MGLQTFGCARHVGCLFRLPKERSLPRGQPRFPFHFIQKRSPEPMAHPYSPSSPVSRISGGSPTRHTPIPVLCGSSSAAAPRRLPLTLWAGLSWAGRTCSWAGLTHPPHGSQYIPPSPVHSTNSTESTRSKALTTGPFTNRSEKQVPRADESPAPTLVTQLPNYGSQTGSFRETLGDTPTHGCLMTNRPPSPAPCCSHLSPPCRSFFLSWAS